MNRFKQLLGSQKSANSTNQPFADVVNLEQQTKLFSDLNELQHTVDLAELSDVERQSCTNYVVYGKVQTVFDDSLKTYFQSLIFDDVNLLSHRNFGVWVSYPFKAIPLPSFTGSVATIINNNSIQINDINDNDYIAGDIITIYDDNGDRSFHRLALVTIDSATQKTLTLQSISSTSVTAINSYVVPSVTRYRRDFKLITDDFAYDSYLSAFSTDIYNHPVQQYHFRDDINIKDMTDCFNNPITELYATFIKSGLTSLNTLQTNPFFSKKPGANNTFYVFEYDLDTIKTQTKDTTPFISGTAFIFDAINYSARTLTSGDTLFGDIYEYDTNTLSGQTITPAAHIFKYFNNPNLLNAEFYYLPHRRMDVKKFSDSLELGNTATTSNIPSYALSYGNNGDVLWRDLLSIGYLENSVNGVNYPFLNNRHYLYSDINLDLIRYKAVAASTITTLPTVDVVGYDTSLTVTGTTVC